VKILPDGTLRVDAGQGMPVDFYFDDRRVAGYAGESVANALWAAGIRTLRYSPSGAPRGMFCAIGVCQECVVLIDGRRQPACTTAVGAGLQVKSLRGPSAETPP